MSLSPVFGGEAGGQALSQAVSSMIVLDNYGRDCALTGQGRVEGQASGLLAGGMLPAEPARWTVGPLNVALALTGSSYQDSHVAERDARRSVSFSVAPAPGQRLTFSANTAVGAQPGEMFGSSLRTVAARLGGTSASWEVNGWTTGFSSGHARQQGVGSAINASITYTMGEVMTPWGLGFRMAELSEAGRMLGAVAGPEFGITGARTRLTTITGARRLLGVDLMAEATAGRTTATGLSELLRFTTPITSTAFSLRGSRPKFGGQLQLGLASPLRVETARAFVLMPMIYDLAAGTLTSEQRLIDLALNARDLELGWWAALSNSFNPNDGAHELTTFVTPVKRIGRVDYHGVSITAGALLVTYEQKLTVSGSIAPTLGLTSRGTGGVFSAGGEIGSSNKSVATVVHVDERGVENTVELPSSTSVREGAIFCMHRLNGHLFAVRNISGNQPVRWLMDAGRFISVPRFSTRHVLPILVALAMIYWSNWPLATAFVARPVWMLWRRTTGGAELKELSEHMARIAR